MLWTNMVLRQSWLATTTTTNCAWLPGLIPTQTSSIPPLPFVVDCFDDKQGSYFYHAYGGPNNNGNEDFFTKWIPHWKWRIFDPI